MQWLNGISHLILDASPCPATNRVTNWTCPWRAL